MSGGADGDPASELERRVRAVAAPLLTIDRRHVDAAFTLLLLAFVGSLLVQTVDYGPQTRLVPLVIGVPTAALLAFLLATQLSPRLAAVAGRYAAGDLFGDVANQLDEFDGADEGEADGQGATDTAAPAGTTSSDGRLELLAVLGWVLALFGLVVVVGFIVGTFAYLVAFYRFQARQGWLRTAVYATVVWVFAVVVFKAVLNTPLYEGLLEVSVPLPV